MEAGEWLKCKAEGGKTFDGRAAMGALLERAATLAAGKEGVALERPVAIPKRSTSQYHLNGNKLSGLYAALQTFYPGSRRSAKSEFGDNELLRMSGAELWLVVGQLRAVLRGKEMLGVRSACRALFKERAKALGCAGGQVERLWGVVMGE